MRILLTGGTGFLGRQIYQRLQSNHEVVQVLAPGRTAAGPFIEWNLSARPPSDFPCFDAVVHCAQSRVYGSFPEGGMETAQVNVGAMAALLDLAVNKGARSFCYLSSGSVYEPYDGSLDETAALSPSSLNGATKLAAEILAAPYAESFAISRLRLFFPYGPGQVQRMVPNLIDTIRAGSAIQLDGKDGLEFAPLFSTDIAALVEANLENQWRGAINVSGPEATTLRSFAEQIGARLGKRPKFQARSDTAPRIIPSTKRLEALYPLSAMTPVDAGLEQTIAAHLK